MKQKLKNIVGKIKGSFLLRAYFTKNFTSKMLAIGECHHYFFPECFIKIDYQNSDFSIDLNNFKSLPFEDSRFDCIVIYHLLEHLDEKHCQKLIKECYRVLKKNGGLRIEVPDMDKFVEAFNKDDVTFHSYFLKNRIKLVNNHGFNPKILEKHITVLGEMASYKSKNIPGIHIPVYATQKEFKIALKKGLRSLNELANSKLTNLQKKTFGHNNSFNFMHLKSILSNTGFSKIHRSSRNKSNIEKLKLGLGFSNLTSRINEKKHREFFSLYVDAIK